MNDPTRFGRELLARENAFDPRFYRTVTGIASTPRPVNGKSLLPSGASAELPIPLLLHHNWAHPLGFVTTLKAVGDVLWFKARFVNVPWHWAYEAWNDMVVEHRLFGVSVYAEHWPLCEPTPDQWKHWTLREISLTEPGDQHNADCWVTRISERIDHGPQPVKLTGKSAPRFEEIIHLAGRTIPGEDKARQVVKLDVVRAPTHVVSLPATKRAPRIESSARREPAYHTRDMSVISKRGRS